MSRVHFTCNGENELSKDQFPVIGIGASAGGLDVFRKFFDRMPADSGMAFILVQHLAPSHGSLIAELLAGHTQMKVLEVVEGMALKPDHVYVIAPDTSLEIINGLFHMSAPIKTHGARLPFDFLLHSLAKQVGERAVAVILSGTGADGSAGLNAIKKGHGFIIAQDPNQAEFDGMPRNAILTGLVDRVLVVGQIPDALISYGRWLKQGTSLQFEGKSIEADKPDFLGQIIDLLRANSVYDFTEYKRGTLERRIERRIAMSEIEPESMEQYLEFLKGNHDGIDILAKDLLINVTNFFRDANIFDLLVDKIVPEMIEKANPSVPLRIWSVGCSSGEETYSLVMIFFGTDIKVQATHQTSGFCIRH